MEKKYELTDETIEWKGRTLHRIRALENFRNIVNKCDIKAGDLGGFIEKEENLSQYDRCWVAGDAKVYDNAFVADDSYYFKSDKEFEIRFAYVMLLNYYLVDEYIDKVLNEF